jgi:type II secretory pathway pseudopilin PulG
MNLGFLAESQRLPDSADTVVVVEPNIGSTSRTKGSLFLLVTGAGGRKLRESTKLVAERIRDDYYYDLSAGISVCLRKAVRASNKALLHSPDRPVLGHDEKGPIGLALAVVRGNELYVATVGPAEAYLVRQARLLTLPDSAPESGMPAEDIGEPQVWHGEITAGDCLILMSPNVTKHIGLGPIQDAVLQLHPQAAVEQIHRQFGSGSLGSTGGDGLLFIEATEVASTHKASPLKPVWPGDSMAGAPDHSPIPLADTVAGGVTAVQTGARHAQIAADGFMRRGVYGLFDRMPQRPMSRGRITPMTVRRERQQRAAFAIIGLLAVIAIVGTGTYLVSGSNRGDNVDRQQQAQQAFAKAKSDIDLVYGNGRDLMASDSKTAAGYLTDAYKQLANAEANGYPAASLADARAQAVAGLDKYYHVTLVAPQVILSFGNDDLEGAVLGPDGAGYVLDTTVSKVYRVDLQTGAKIAVAASNQLAPAPGGVVGVVTNPRLLTTGGGEVLILDSSNSLWTWHPAAGNRTGRGILKKVFIPDDETWGLGARAMGTFIINAQIGQYNFYIVVPSQSQVVKYPPAPDGSGYPSAARANYLSVAQDLNQVTDMYVDGKVYLVDKGKITQYQLGQAVRGWNVDAPSDTLIRPKAPFYTHLIADNIAQDQGTFYAYDNANRRIVAFKKLDGTIVGQYMVPANLPWFSALTGMFVTGGVTTVPATATSTAAPVTTPPVNPVLYWTESGNLMGAPLVPTAAPAPSPSVRGTPALTGSPKASR